MLNRITREDLQDWGIETPADAAAALAGRPLEDGRHGTDVISEIADATVPVYYNEILSSWRDLPPGYRNRALEEGIVDLDPNEGAIQYKAMMADLYLFYEDQVREVLQDLAEDDEDDED